MQLILRSGFLGLAFSLLAAHFAWSQAPIGGGGAKTGEIHLQVNDPSGAGLRSTGSVAGPSTNRAFRTDLRGNVFLSGLVRGKYQIEISSPGFASQRIAVEIRSGTPIDRQVTLNIQGIATSITVLSPTPIGLPDQSGEQIPVPVQGLTAKDLEDSNALDLTDLMNKRLTSVYLNDNAGIPTRQTSIIAVTRALRCWARRKGFRPIWMACVRTSRSGILSPGILFRR